MKIHSQKSVALNLLALEIILSLLLSGCGSGVNHVEGELPPKDTPLKIEDSLRQDAEDNFTFQHEDSVGSFYLGNGQIIEYRYDSLYNLISEYRNATEFKKESLNSQINGRYIKLDGQISDVLADGTLVVGCIDDELSSVAEIDDTTLSFYDYDMAYLNLLNTQDIDFTQLSKDTQVLAFGRIDTEQLYYDGCSLFDAILVLINDKQIEVPLIGYKIDGITTYPDYPKDNSISPSNSNLLDANSLNGAYSDEADGIYVEIASFDNGNTYYLTYVAGDVWLESIPTYSIEINGTESSLMFDIGESYPDYPGIVEFTKSGDGQYIMYSLWSNVENCANTGGYYSNLLNLDNS